MTTEPILLPKTRDRRKFLGGTDAAAVMGVGAFGRTPYNTWLAKTNQLVREKMDPERELWLKRRKRWEPVVIKMLREEFDAKVVATNRVYQDAEHGFLAAEVDFEWIDEDGSVQNGEIKTVHPFAYGEKHGWGEAGTADIPVQYGAQAMHGLGVTGRRVCVVAALIGIDTMIFYRVERIDDTLAGMRTQCVNFWHNHVLAGVAPDPQTIADLHLIYKVDQGLDKVCDDDEVASKALRLRALRGQIDAWELEEASLEFDLKLYMKDAAGLMIGGKRVVTWKKAKWSRLDQDALKAENPDVHKQYLRTGEHRVFKVNRGL